jgi:hypothetical protein
LRKSGSRLRFPEIRLSMQSLLFRPVAVVLVGAGAVLAGLLPGAAWAARIGVLANNYQNETAADFNANVKGHTFTPVDVSTNVPSPAFLAANFDVVLLFEDNTFVNAPAVGSAVAAFARSGHTVVLGTFYDQDRSDGSIAFTPHGWGALETIDPNTTDGIGTAYNPRSLDPASLVAHPLTAGVTALSSSRFAGGNQAKPGTVVVANWAQKNAREGADPAIAYRISQGACVIHVAIAPQYPSIGAANTDWGGDFHRVWRNAFDFGAEHCVTGVGYITGPAAIAIPALSNAGLALTALLLAFLAASTHARVRRR